MSVVTLTKEFAGKQLTLETGKLAKLATGAVTVTIGGTTLLVTATVAKKPREGMDFFPLLVDYQEKFYATGKFKGSRFIKREGRPPDSAILAARMIDRPLRPLFPKGMRSDVQVVVTVLSADMENDPEDISILGSSMACLLMNAGFSQPVAGVRIGMVKDETGQEKLVLNPNYEEVEQGSLDLMVAGTENAITMIESAAKEIPTDTMIKALEMAHMHIKDLCAMQREFLAQVGDIPEKKISVHIVPEEVETAVSEFVSEDKVAPLFDNSKEELEAALAELEEEVKAHFADKVAEEREENPWTDKLISEVVGSRVKHFMRKKVLDQEVRLDGRKLDEVRPVSCEVGVLAETHGTGLFNRGETQVLSVLTLGSPGDVQVLDEMDVSIERSYMHHYNFPGFSVGEVSPMRGVGRREIGHGDLAERALLPVLPSKEEFPYTMRVVSEVLASNGSSSMGSVCGSTLCLMDGGVPIKKPVSGIAMGLIMDKETGNYKILSDIQGQEDFLGDMDFKVAGTTDGITALQLDIKIEGLTMEILKTAIEQGNVGRQQILDKMLEVLPSTRTDLSQNAPRIITIKIDPEQIGAVIGTGGKVIREITEVTEVKMDIDDDGLVMITSNDAAKAQQAKEWVERLTYKPQVGDEFENAKVVRITTFGAFVEIAPGIDGLVHISELAPVRVNKVEDVVKEGDLIKVRVKGIDEAGKISLTHKPFSKFGAKDGGRPDAPKGEAVPPKRD